MKHVTEHPDLSVGIIQALADIGERALDAIVVGKFRATLDRAGEGQLGGDHMLAGGVVKLLGDQTPLLQLR